MKSTIYTRTGDKGKTGLYNGDREYKSDLIFDVLGSIDEVISILGLCKALHKEELGDNVTYYPPGNGWYRDSPCTKTGKHYEWFLLTQIMNDIQARLFDINSHIATPTGPKVQEVLFEEDNIKKIEKLIDKIDGYLPKLTSFILPGGGKFAATFHQARTTTRTAERKLWKFKMHLSEKNEDYIDDAVLKYINRLSDLFFVISRFINFSLREKEIPYKKSKSNSWYRTEEEEEKINSII